MTPFPRAEVFLNWLLQQTLNVSVLVIVILLIQWLFKKHLTARWRFALWWVVLVGLLLPVRPPSSFSLYNHVHADALLQGPRYSVPANSSPVVPETSLHSPMENRAEMADIPLAARAESNVQADEAVPAQSAVKPLSDGPPRSFWSRYLGIPGREVGWDDIEIPSYFALWLLGVVIFSLYVGRMVFRFRRQLAGHCLPASPEVQSAFDECRRRMQVNRRVELWETEAVKSPALYGLFRLQLLLPKGLAATFSEAELRHIFLHELAHVKRGDMWLNWLVTSLQIFHWFNPFIWLAFARLRADRELACDELALIHSGEAHGQNYGQTILKLLENINQTKPMPGLVGIVEDRKQMAQRLRTIAAFRLPTKWSRLAVLLVLGLALIGLTGAQVPSPSSAEIQLERKAAAKPKPVANEGNAQSAITNFTGRVLLPDGKPATGASVVFPMESYSIMLGKRRFETSNGLLPLVVDKNGEFQYALMSGCRAVEAVHEQGIAHMAMEDFKKNPVIQLQAWGRIDGVLRIGDKAMAGEKLRLESLVPVGLGDEPRLSGAVFATVSDDAGRFVFESVPPGELKVARIVSAGPVLPIKDPKDRTEVTAKSHMGLYSHQRIVVVAPGENVKLVMGGKGMTLRGKVGLSGDGGPLDWTTMDLNAQLASNPVPEPWVREGRLVPESGELQEYMRSKEFRTVERERSSYHFTVKADGTIEVSDVLPGTYNLSLSVYKKWSYPLSGPVSGPEQIAGFFKKDIVIPEKTADGAMLIDLGEFILKGRSAAPQPKEKKVPDEVLQSAVKAKSEISTNAPLIVFKGKGLDDVTSEPVISRFDIDGAVKDEQGQPIAGATVFVYEAVPKVGPADCPSCYADCGKRSETGQFGEFHLPALDSLLRFKLFVVRQGYLPQFVSRVDTAKSLVDVSLKKLSPAESPDKRINGKVVDPQGNPVKGALIVVKGLRFENSTVFGSSVIDPLAVSDEQGVFTLNSSQHFSGAILDVETRTFAKTRFASVTPGELLHELKLTEGSSVTGRLLKDGVPLSGVEVSLFDVIRGAENSMGRFSALTSESGKFTFLNIPSSRNYNFNAKMQSLNEKGCLTNRVVKLGGDGTKSDLGDLGVKPGFLVAGRVKLPAGHVLPAGSKMVLQRYEKADAYAVPVEDDGSFRFENVPGELMEMWVRLDGYRMSLRNASMFPPSPDHLIGLVSSDRRDLLIDLESGPPLENPIKGDYDSLLSEPLRGSESRQPLANDLVVTGQVIDAQNGQPVREFKLTEGRYDGFQRNFIWFDSHKNTFTNGAFTTSFTAQPKPAGFLIEAKGYLPKASEPIYSSTTNLVFALQKGGNLVGTVKLPDGRPARNVAVYLIDMRTMLEITSDIRLQFELNRGLKSVRTDANGRFSLPPSADAYGLYVYESAGFAEVLMGDFAKTPVLQMKPLARIEGKLLIGSKLAGDQEVIIGYAAPLYLYHPRTFAPINLSMTTKTKADGTFVFEALPPVAVEVSHVPKVKESRMGSLPIAQNTGFVLKPGETRALTLGGQGRPVTGRFVIEGYTDKIDWRQDVSSLELVVADPPGIPSLFQLSAEFSKAVYAAKTEEEKQKLRQEYAPKREAIIKQWVEFYHTDVGMQYYFSKKKYALNFQQDGSFRVEDVPPGKYELRFELRGGGDGSNRMSAPLIAITKKQLEMPAIPNGRDDQPLDLGIIVVPQRGLMKSAKADLLPQ